MARILVIDDEQQARTLFHNLLVRAGHETVTVPDGEDGLHLMERQPFEVVVTDLVMPGKEGIETIMDLRAQYPEVKIIAISGGGRIGPDNYLEAAAGLGADRTFAKPVKREDLLAAIDELLSTS